MSCSLAASLAATWALLTSSNSFIMACISSDILKYQKSSTEDLKKKTNKS